MGTSDDTTSCGAKIRMRLVNRMLGLAACAGMLAWSAPAWAIRSDSPEVRQLIEAGLAAIEKPGSHGDDFYAERLGARCIVGLAFLKAGKPDHPRVDEAVKAARAAMTSGEKIDVYSNGIVIVFFCELSPERYRREIQWYLDLLRKRQKEHGGWGYDGNSAEGADLPTGDTSQTQYASLGYWSAYRHGFAIQPESLERLTQWILRTQDPAGAWGYQGVVTQTSQRVGQSQISCSMLAAGMSSLLICADLLDAAPAGLDDGSGWTAEDMLLEDLPPALRAAREGDANRPPPVQIHTGKINLSAILESIDLARGWMDKNYTMNLGNYFCYYLYATERYQSFYDLLEGTAEEEPKWYTDGYELLRAKQRPDGGWNAGCGMSVDTAFAVLFLMRSTQKSIQSTLGEGTLVAGRGIPSNVARARLRGNQVVVEQVQTKLEEMLSMVDDADQSHLDELARDPTSLVVGQVDVASARRLQQLVRGGEPAVRLLSVRALGRTGNLDYVPTLIYALTDPDRDVVLEARDSLEFVSRRFNGFGPPDSFTDKQRFDAVDAWKNWYRSLRPGVLPD
jgi:HEAT repeats/Squalene-hopene cyclase C-terminal domain/Prenyltransferase and squalene oxidase repeat